MKKLKQIGLLLLPFIALAGFLLFTNPYDVPLPLLTIPFALLGFGIFQLQILLLHHVTKLSAGKVRMIASLVSSLVLLLILLQSIRQLSLKDFLLLIALVTGLTFYLRRS